VAVFTDDGALALLHVGHSKVQLVVLPTQRTLFGLLQSFRTVVSVLIEVFPLNLEHTVRAIEIKSLAIFQMLSDIFKHLINAQLFLRVDASVFVSDLPFNLLEGLDMFPDDLVRNDELNFFTFVRTNAVVVLLLAPLLDALAAEHVAAAGTLQRVCHQLMADPTLVVLVDVEESVGQL